jgi:hypothetical protein
MMKYFDRAVRHGLFALFIAALGGWSFGEKVQGQVIVGTCFVPIMRQCSTIEFQNPCEGKCKAEGNHCGFSIVSFRNTTYNTVDLGGSGLDQYTSIGTKKCGALYNCFCVEVGPQRFSCRLNGTPVMDAYAHESIPTGDPGEDCLDP